MRVDRLDTTIERGHNYPSSALRFGFIRLLTKYLLLDVNFFQSLQKDYSKERQVFFIRELVTNHLGSSNFAG